MTEKITVSVLLDPATVEKIADLQSQKRVFSRSMLLREVIEKGLKAAEKEMAKK